MIIADSCIALHSRALKPKSYRKFAISSEHIGLRMVIEQPKKRNAVTALAKIVAALTCTVCLISQCIEDMTVLG